MVSVSDDDPIPLISIANTSVSVLEGESITIPITLSNRTSEMVEIDWGTSTTGGTATASDFTGMNNQTLEIASGLTGSITIATTSDTEDEGNETLL